MKTKLFLSFFFTLCLSSLVFSALSPTRRINFGGGLNIKTSATEIDENESPDMSNMINDVYGASFKRKGSARWISQAYSSHPVTSLFRAYSSTGSTKILIATTRDSIVKSTTDVAPTWVTISSGMALNQHYTFAIMNQKVIIAGDKLTDPIKSYDVEKSSFADLLTDTTTVIIRAKYVLNAKNYMFYGNVRQVPFPLTSGTTDYPNRVYYSQLIQASSVTANRYLEVRTDDGEVLTGMGEIAGNVHIFKESSIHELIFEVLSPNSDGDQELKQRVTGFGCIAPRTLVNIGDVYVFLSRDGIRTYDTRTSNVISVKIQPIIDEIIQSGTQLNCSAIYYPKKRWYVFSYEDPNSFPKGVANSVLVFDFNTGNWYKFKNWNAESFVTQDGSGDGGELFYGDSNDGYVYKVDQDIYYNDARKEISVDVMDSTATGSTVLWNRGTRDLVNIKEGTASIKLPTLSATVFVSSISRMGIFDLGDWPDRTEVTRDDKLSFKVYISSISNLSSLRVDLEIDDIYNASDFNTIFSSVTISSASITTTDNSWTTMEIPISSFTVLDSWVSLSGAQYPFARNLTFFGIRFVSTGIGGCNTSIDDIRIVQESEQPLNAYRFTKQFDLGAVQEKDFKKLILTREKDASSLFNVDVYSDFGQLNQVKSINSDFDKEIFLTGITNDTVLEGIEKRNSIDFSVIDSTRSGLGVLATITFNFGDYTNRNNTLTNFFGRPGPIVVDETNIYALDMMEETGNQSTTIFKISKSSITKTEATIKSTQGSGATQFNSPQQMSLDDTNLYIADRDNNRIKVYRKSDLTFITSYGTQGTTTGTYPAIFNLPTGVVVDDQFIYVGNDRNTELLKIYKSTGGFVTRVPLNIDNIGNMRLHVDEYFLYVYYMRTNSVNVNNNDLILEKRKKTDLSLVNKAVILPDGLNESSTSRDYEITGDISGNGYFMYIPFFENTNNKFYLQKRLKSDFSLVKELIQSSQHYSVAANSIDYKPKRKSEHLYLGSSGDYIQLKYYDSALDNTMDLINQTFYVVPHEIR